MNNENLRTVEFTQAADSPITVAFKEDGHFDGLVKRGVGYVLDGNIIERYTKHRTGVDKVKSYSRTYELSIIGFIKDMTQVDYGAGLVRTKLRYIPNNKHPVFRKSDVIGNYSPSLLFNPAIDKLPIVTGIVIEYEPVATKVAVAQDLPEIKTSAALDISQELPRLTEPNKEYA